MGANHRDPDPEVVLRVKSLEKVLSDKGLIDPEAIDTLVDFYENKVGPQNGAKVGRGHGPTRNTKRGFLRMEPLR